VNRAAPENVNVLGSECAVLREGCVHGIGVKAVGCELSAQEVLAENGGDQTLADTAFALKDEMNLTGFRLFVLCACHVGLLI
jgi:hypothetical protein